jgi:hypothetical protein
MFNNQKLLLIFHVALLALLGGCETKPECDSIETRTAVLQAINDDHRNPLGNFAAEKNTAKREKPMYQLGQQIVTRSAGADKRTLKCSGALSATVGDTKGTKEVTFTVQKSSDGKVSVSVDPFQF